MTSLATFNPTYVTDTNALYWYVTSDPRLSPNAKAVFEAAVRGETQIIISAISMAEFYFIQQKKPLPRSYSDIYQDLKSKSYFQFVEFDTDDTLDFLRDAAVPEMHDRIIAGLARRIGAPLITSDAAIAASGLVQIIW